MTTQIVSLLKEKAMTASDSAVTVNNTKVWKNVDKTFKLCDNPPINIMINGSPTINNFPVKLLINEFEKIVKSDNIKDITEEFLEYIGKTVPLTNVESFIEEKFSEFKFLYGSIDETNYEMILELTSEYNIEMPNYIKKVEDSKFEGMIEPNVPKNVIKKLKFALRQSFCEYLITQSTGLVITGINTHDHFPSSISFNIIMNNNGKIEILNKHSELNCNQTKLEVFGQTDVINFFLTGIDENFEIRLYFIIKNIFKPTSLEEELLKKEINRLKNINKTNILKHIATLPDDDMYEMMKILIKSTELKRKLVSDVDSVGGDIHIEKITKNNGIEKHEKIYNLIKTIKK